MGGGGAGGKMVSEVPQRIRLTKLLHSYISFLSKGGALALVELRGLHVMHRMGRIQTESSVLC